MGVTGVPTFLIGGRYVVTGAQTAELWERVID
jgi:predicted DsbA family dithiol-disulfide isomerase